MTFQFHIKQYGLKGDGSGALGTGWQLILKVIGTNGASEKNVWLGDFDTIAHAKFAAVSLFTAANVSPFDISDTYWSPAAAATTAAEVLSTVFTHTLPTS